MQKIMIIEDAPVIREELQLFLTHYGYEVEAPTEFKTIINQVQKSQPHLILLDINLPIFDGYYLCKEIRKLSDVPIIIVTSRDSEMDELMSMNLGADDFVTKPYNTQILLARIASLLKRTYGQQATSDILMYRNLSLNLANSSMTFESNTLELTKNELKILAYLIKNQG
ncbi:MAG: response regulator transcription factor, partial [Turicibacter sp.]|nr:response regulator transcription factor [Turicibacter sp.]